MTDQTSDGGPSLSFEKVRDLARPERAPTAAELITDHGANLAFEAAPRAEAGSHSADDESDSASHSFKAVPASVAVAQQRLSTASVGVRPWVGDVTGVNVPGGKGWNIRHREEENAQRGHAEPVDAAPAWSSRTTPAMTADRSRFEVPAAPVHRRLSGRMLMGVVLGVILVGVLGFAGVEWATGRTHATVTIATPASVGSLAAITTPATAAVTQQMQKVMLAYGATKVVSGVYGTAGRPMLVVLLAQGPNIEATSSAFFNDFASGLQSDGVTVNKGKSITTTNNGSDFVCSPATLPSPTTTVSVCGWDDGSVIGLVMDVSGQPVDATLREAEAARSAGEI
jgi:hypothetical protein